MESNVPPTSKTTIFRIIRTTWTSLSTEAGAGTSIRIAGRGVGQQQSVRESGTQPEDVGQLSRTHNIRKGSRGAHRASRTALIEGVTVVSVVCIREWVEVKMDHAPRRDRRLG